MSGPDQTLDNFMTHLKNKMHKERVEARLKEQAEKEGGKEKENGKEKEKEKKGKS